MAQGWTGMAAFAAALVLPGSVHAQAAPPAAQVVTLLQVTIRADPAVPEGRARIEAFGKATAAITRCADAVSVARAFKGALFWRSGVDMARVPAPLAAQLRSRPVGRATSVFGGTGAFRVLLICPASFRRPADATQDMPTA